MSGIISYGGFIPRYRLNRGVIFKAMGWFNAGTFGYAKGEKAVANYDEDSITMATAAGLDCLSGFDASKVEGLFFASTTMPYRERQNAGIITTALGLNDHVRSADFSAALKAGTSALLSALDAVGSGNNKQTLVCASDCRLGKMGGNQEMIFGDAAAAFLMGNDNVVAEFKGSYSSTLDFVDHYRGEGAEFDRGWEDRWIRDLGYDTFIPEVVKGLVQKCNLNLADFAKVVFPCHYDVEHAKIAKMLGLKPEQVQNPLQENVGDSGTAQPLVMLVNALEQSKAGDKIVVISFGSGCDALYFQVTENISKMKGKIGIAGHLAKKAPLASYEKYAVFRGMLPVEVGIRGEVDLPTPFSLLWRNRKTVLGLEGSKCLKCGTPQFPPQRICANPKCDAQDQMEPYRFVGKQARIFTYTGDNLAASYDPPAIYGIVEFEGGGRFMFNFTDCDLNSVKVGMPVDMSFRKKYYDEKRGIHGYFWKAVPREEVA